MDNNNLHSTTEAKKKQQRNLALVGIVLALVLWGVYTLVSEHSTYFGKKKEQGTEIEVSSPLSHVDESKVWVERTQNAVASAQKATDTLQQQLVKLNEEKANQQKTNQLASQQLQTLQAQINQLEDKLNKFSRGGAGGNPFTTVPEQTMEGVSQDTLQLSSQNTSIKPPVTPSKNPDTYVPAGTFVRAALIGSADASAAVNSQSNPTPVLLRVLDQGTLPNNQKSHLKNCTATAAAIGDISAERAQIRLEKLTCVSPTSEIVEIPVEATVFGPDGKNGVRGVPLWREGALLKRAFISGAFSGFSKGLALEQTSVSTAGDGTTTTTITPNDVFKYGAASGASNAMDKLADYNIKRAEQYHPVIQVSAGTVVDIVFLKGFYLDGDSHDPKKETIVSPFGMTTAAAPMSSVPSTSNTTTQLPLTAQQIDALKAKTATQGSL